MSQEVLMSTLRFAVSMKRPYGGVCDGRLAANLAAMRPDVSHIDGAGNVHVDLRLNDSHRTLFVAHTDTVHTKDGVNTFDDSTPMWKAQKATPSKPKRKIGKKGKPVVNVKGEPVFEVPYFSTRNNALGADDGAGVAMLAALIDDNVPAYYIFTRGEECGGIGSKFLADEWGDLLSQFDRAIAIDRRDTFSVITHQAGGRCCSDEFAEGLAAELNMRGMMYMPDDTGVYTDTAEFIRLIPECTNLSAGYYDEHSDNERLDTAHLQQLYEAMRTVDWDDLPVERDPSKREAREMVLWSGWQRVERDDKPIASSDEARSAFDKQYGKADNSDGDELARAALKRRADEEMKDWADWLRRQGKEQEAEDLLNDPFYFDENPGWRQ